MLVYLECSKLERSAHAKAAEINWKKCYVDRQIIDSYWRKGTPRRPCTSLLFWQLLTGRLPNKPTPPPLSLLYRPRQEREHTGRPLGVDLVPPLQ